MPGDRRSTSARRAHSAGSHRARRRRPLRILRLAANAAAVASGTAIGLAAFAIVGIGPFREPPAHHERPASTEAAADTPSHGTSASGANSAVPNPRPSSPSPRTLPLGKRTLRTIADRTTQVVVVRGTTTTSSVATVEFYERVEAGWIRVATWQGHVGKRGWATNHVEGDLKTPAGTFALSDAGGRKPNPGSNLPYHRSTAFEPPPRQPGFGDSMADAFDYVIAVDYNRVRGRSPLDRSRPLGAQRGGGIWLHVDHDGPTHGCISIPAVGVRYLLLHLTLESHPVVVMGDRAQLGL
jgi:L,D-peptidoglycan transpeptidase YkuD (ErfK/YbiS/YcfS/YnhG family)